MKKVIADQWVKALRSKKYAQGTGALRNEYNEFCCLGVLCNLHAEAKPKFAATQDDLRTYGGEDSFPPPFVQNWAGLKSKEALINLYEDSLVDLNDGGSSFEEIATIIEKNWRKL